MSKRSLVCNEIMLDGDLEPVFDVVTTTRYWPRWHPATQAVSGVTDRPLQLGDQVRERAIIGGRAHEGTWTVSEHVRPTRLVLQIDAGRIEITYRFAAFENRTLLRRELCYRPGDFAGGDVDPAGLEARMHAQSAEALRQLKDLVDRQLPLERNKRIVQRHLERVFNARDVDAVHEVFTADAAIHDPGTDFHGPAELGAALQKPLAAFPDFHFTVEEALAEGERIASFWAQPDQLSVFRQIGASA
jgi:hypothetical protein